MKTNGSNVIVDNDVNLVKNVITGLESLIRVCGDDPSRDGLTDTPSRVLRAFMEYTLGNHEEPKAHLAKLFDVSFRDIVIVRDIEIYSMCEHHFAPFFGVAHVGYIPSNHVTGLSKIARMVEGYAKRFQVQERLTEQIVNAMDEMLEPQGVMAVVIAKHMCMCGRGIRKSTASTITKAVRGLFQTDECKRNEFLSLIQTPVSG